MTYSRHHSLISLKNIKKISVLVLAFLLLVPSFTFADTGTSSSFDKPTVVPLNFVPEDSLLNPTEPVLYFTSVAEKKVYAFNYQTREMQSLSLNLAPERMAFQNNELYVTMTYGHFYNDAPNGSIAIIDPTTFTLKDTIPVTTDPYSIVVDSDSYMYVFPGSGQWGNVLSYDRATKKQISQSSIYMKMQSRFDPQTNSIITVDRDLSPLDLFKLDVSQGKFNTSTDSPYHGDFPLRSWIQLSPDGKYVFDSSGDIFSESLQHVSKLNNAFSDVAFDPEHDRFFTGESPKIVVAYDYNNGVVDETNRFQATGSFYTQGDISRLFYQNNTLISVSTLAANQYFLEIYAMPSEGLPKTDPTAMPDMPGDSWVTPTLTPVTPEVKTFSLNVNPQDSLLDPTRPVIYFTNNNSNSVVAFNYETNTMSEVKFSLNPERLAYYNDELYVTLSHGHEYWTESKLSGAIGIIDAKSFTYKDQINVDTDPYDVIVDHQGFVYVLPGSNQWQPILAYSRITKQKLGASSTFRAWSFAEPDPLDNGFYSVDTDSSPRDMQKAVVSQGQFLKLFDSPYHGDYPMATNFRVTPDGRYVFNGSGEIFDSMLSHVSTISSFTDIAFDIQNKRFFAGSKDGTITLYDYDNNNLGRVFHQLGTFKTGGSANNLYYRDNQLVVLGNNALKVYTIEPGTIPQTGGEIDGVNTNPVDNNAPFALADTFPPANSTDLPVNTPVVVQFNHTLQPGENYAAISLTDSTGQSIPVSTHISANVLVVLPQVDLAYDSTYTVNIPAKAVADMKNTVYDQEIKSQFQTGSEYSRLGGTDRIETSVKISQQGWSTSGVVVLATAANFPDALAAAPLAKQYAAPILLTDPNQLSPATAEEIKPLNPSVIAIIGGTGAISQGIEDGLKAQGIECVRIAGKDRYETSLEIAKYLDAPKDVFVVSGSNFPDALSVASYAAANDDPIILSPQDGLSKDTLDWITSIPWA